MALELLNQGLRLPKRKTIFISARKECLLFGSIMSAVDPVTVIAVFEEVKVTKTSIKSRLYSVTR